MAKPAKKKPAVQKDDAEDAPKKAAGGGKRTMLGGKAVEVDIKPTLKTRLNKTAVVVWGRMNPPTRGHQRIVNVANELAIEHQGDAYLVLSKTVNDKNPLKYADKISLAEQAFGDRINVVNEQSIKTIVHMAQFFSETHNNLVVVTGEEQAADYTKLFTEYNHKDFDFDSIYVVPVERDDASATDARKAVKDGNLAEFTALLPRKIQDQAKTIFEQISFGHTLSKVLAEGKDSKSPFAIAQRVILKKVMPDDGE